MERRNRKRIGVLFAVLAFVATATFQSPVLLAQAAAQRFVGTITAIAGDTLTVKSDAGEIHQVSVPASAAIKQLAPGQKDLSSAQTIQLGDLAIGDRVFVKLDPDTSTTPAKALQVVAMKQTDIAQKQQKDREDWQRNGVGGLVKSVDPSSGVVMLTIGAGPAAKAVTVHVTQSTVLKRYAPSSVRFTDAQPAPLDAVHVGDQFHVRGQKNADGTEITAAEVVSGGFRNISGTVTAMDTTASTLTVKDLATKKNVTIHITPDAEMRRLPDMMARMIAGRLKGSTTGGGAPTTMSARPQGGGPPAQGMQGGQGGQGGPGAGGGTGRRGTGDLEQALDRAPAVQLGDLKKGEAVMLVSTEGANEVTAIRLLAGVEPLLEAPAASQNLLSSWSMGSGGAEAAAQ
jgi:hypothetical protein